MAVACGGDDDATGGDIVSNATEDAGGGSSSSSGSNGSSSSSSSGGTDASTDAPVSPTAPVHDAYVLLAGNRIAGLQTAKPGEAETPWAVDGVDASVALTALQWRPRNGFLYALGYSALYDEVHLYAISVASKRAKQVGKKSTIKPALKGTSLTFDFNAYFDRMNVVSNAGECFSMSPSSGLVRDEDKDPNNGNTPQAELSGGTSKLAGGTAWTGNHPSMVSTTQYTIAGNTLYLQTINTNVLKNPLPLANVLNVRGFDIPLNVESPAPFEPVVSGKGIAVATMMGSAIPQLVNIDLTNGNVIPIGALPFEDVLGFTLVPTDAPRRFLGLYGGNSLSHYSAVGGGSAVNIQGIAAGENLVGITSHPHTGQVFGLAVNIGTKKASLYVVDDDRALPVGDPGSIGFVDGEGKAVILPVAGSPGATNWGFDIDPTTGMACVVTATGLNFRVDTETGLPVDGDAVTAGINTDPKLSGASTSLRAIAFTSDIGAESTTAYGIDSSTKALHVVSPAGVVGAPIPITVDGANLELTGVGGFDISPAGGNGYAALTVGDTEALYEVNLSTGVAKKVDGLYKTTSVIVSR